MEFDCLGAQRTHLSVQEFELPFESFERSVQVFAFVHFWSHISKILNTHYGILEISTVILLVSNKVTMFTIINVHNRRNSEEQASFWKPKVRGTYWAPSGTLPKFKISRCCDSGKNQNDATKSRVLRTISLNISNSPANPLKRIIWFQFQKTCWKR